MPVEVPAGRVARGRLRVPSSKSVTQRYFALALIGGNAVTVRRPLLSEDPRLFLDAMAVCGFDVAHEGEGAAVRLAPVRPPGGGEILCGNGGTMFRFLTAALTVLPGTWRLDGVARLRQRPVGPLIAALRALGAGVACPRREGYAPIEIAGASLRGGRARLDAGASSQYLSALLIAGLAAPEPSEITVERLASSPYVDLTLEAIARFGGRVAADTESGGARRFRVTPSALRGGTVTVEGDYSAAAYPAGAAALTGGEVTLEGLRRDSVQGDRRMLELLAEMGAAVRWSEAHSVTVAGRSLTAVDADLADMPDQVPTLAALAPFARGTTRIRNVAHLRIKESDRLKAMATELGRVGVPAHETVDGLEVPGVWAEEAPPDTPVEVATWDDHRIAMAMALVALRRPGVRIADPEVVAKSYPDFWRDLERLIGD